MRWLWNNEVLSAEIDCFSEHPDHPLANIQDSRLSRRYRTIGTVEEWIKIEGPLQASYCAILGHNLTEGATITLQGNNEDEWDSNVLFEEELDWSEDIIIKEFDSCTYNYWRIVISDDESAGDGYISIGAAYLGTYLQLPNLDLDAELPFSITDEVVESASGQTYFDEGYDYRSYKVNHSGVTETLRKAMVLAFKTFRRRPIILLFYADRLDIERPMYCFLEQKELAFKRTGNVLAPYSVSIKYKETY